MIIVDRDRCSTFGDDVMLLAEFAGLTQVLAKRFPKELLSDAFESGFMTEEELREQIKRNKESTAALRDFVEFLKKTLAESDTEEKPQDTFNSMFGDLFNE